MCCKVLRTPCRECFCYWRALNFTRKVWRSGCCSSAWHIQRRFYLNVWTSDLGKGFGVLGFVEVNSLCGIRWLRYRETSNCLDSSRHVYAFLESISFRGRWRQIDHCFLTLPFLYYFLIKRLFFICSQDNSWMCSPLWGQKKKKMSLSFFMAQFVRRTVSQCFVGESLAMTRWWFMQRAVKVVPCKELVEAGWPSG